MNRRDFVAWSLGTAGSLVVVGPAAPQEETDMYGLIGQMLATPGQRGELAEILIDGVSGMPGCLSYVVAEDSQNPDALWVTEVWDSRASHEASLSLPSVREAIERGRPLIAGFGQRFETVPLGGHGLSTEGPGR